MNDAARRLLVERLPSIDGVIEGKSVFSSQPGYWVNAKEIAHFEDDGASLEVRLTRAVIREHRAELKADPRVELRRNTSDWIRVFADTRDDAEFIVGLVTLAAAAHRPPDGVTAKPPPTGADLERRRRFH